MLAGGSGFSALGNQCRKRGKADLRSEFVGLSFGQLERRRFDAAFVSEVILHSRELA